MENEARLPIKVVVPQKQDLRPVPKGGGPRKLFEYDSRFREILIGQLNKVRNEFKSVLNSPAKIPAVARITLKKEALAKSHKPMHLFSQHTCPIIGGENFGNILVSVSNSGIDQLENYISNSPTNDIFTDITTLERIEPYTANDAVGSLGIHGLSQLVSEKNISSLKLKLFQHSNPSFDKNIKVALSELIQSLGLSNPEPIQFLSGLKIFRINKVSADLIPQLAGFVGTQSLGFFTQFQLVNQYISRGEVAANSFPQPDPNITYPIVGIIDSGTDPNNKFLQSWVVDRDEEDVPRTDQDNNHGSFVAGLIINGQKLNHEDLRFPASQAKIIDVVAVPKPITPVDETDFLKTIHRVIPKYPEVKVWNLSISRTDMVCSDGIFSDFGMELDTIQKKYDITFVVCSGNFTTPPLRGWPPDDLGENDRIFPPADTALGITVGSIAHTNQANSRVRKEEPSPFSRRGPGAAFLPKPEVCHYGGNCTDNLDHQQVGIISLDGNGNVAEAIGTSFSTPLISSVLANLRHAVTEPISRNLAKALIVHSAAMRSGRINASHLKYMGFGIPGEIKEVLTCTPWQATLIFEPQLHPSLRIFARENFPIPDCFRLSDGRVAGEFLMTLVYDPPLDTSAGAEYCQSNIDISLGTYDPGKNGKIKHVGKIPLEPKDYSKLYESYLIEHGFKWSPVKVYRKKLARTSGDSWRIYMRMHHRGLTNRTTPQNVALIITLIDPARQKPVYDDVVRTMNQSGWLTQDLKVSERLRIRT